MNIFTACLYNSSELCFKRNSNEKSQNFSDSVSQKHQKQSKKIEKYFLIKQFLQ